MKIILGYIIVVLHKLFWFPNSLFLYQKFQKEKPCRAIRFWYFWEMAVVYKLLLPFKIQPVIICQNKEIEKEIESLLEWLSKNQ